MIFEYTLLLVIALLISAIIMRNLVGNADDQTGMKGVWMKMIQTIGQDVPDDPQSPPPPKQ